MGPIIEYLVSCLRLDENVLRDSTLMRLELPHFEAYIHTSAIMWVAAYHELRAMTNSTVVDLNPMEVNAIYDEMWMMGTLLQGPGKAALRKPLNRADRGSYEGILRGVLGLFGQGIHC